MSHRRMEQKSVGIIGLGKMGGGLALQALEKGWRVVGYTLGAIAPDLMRAGLVAAQSLGDFKELLPRRRLILIYIPAGEAVDHVLLDLEAHLDSGDVVADGGNSYWGDSMRRAQSLSARDVHFIDLGTSGGIAGARHGACFMAGGAAEAVAFSRHLLESLAVPGGFVHAGPSGAGHYTKLVHNGIEFGMLQAIGEGMNLLERWPHAKLPVLDVLECWTNGSVIRSWLIELMAQGYRRGGGLESISSHVEDTGEVNWLVADALQMEVPVPVIAQSVMQLFASRDTDKLWARAVSEMRHEFGGHPFGPDAAIAKERRTGRTRDVDLDA